VCSAFCRVVAFIDGTLVAFALVAGMWGLLF
jgi:hypothetical protein